MKCSAVWKPDTTGRWFRINANLPLNMSNTLHADISSQARGLSFGMSLPLLLCFVYVRGEDSGETVHMNRLV